MGEKCSDYSTAFPILSVHKLNPVNELARDADWRTGAIKYLLAKDSLSKNKRKKPAMRIAQLIYSYEVLASCTWTGRALDTAKQSLQLLMFINKLYMETTQRLQPDFTYEQMGKVFRFLCQVARNKIKPMHGNAQPTGTLTLSNAGIIPNNAEQEPQTHHLENENMEIDAAVPTTPPEQVLSLAGGLYAPIGIEHCIQRYDIQGDVVLNCCFDGKHYYPGGAQPTKEN